MRDLEPVAVLFASALCLAACAAPQIDGDDAAISPRPAPTVAVHATTLPPPPSRFRETGAASWYGRDFQSRPTASGEPYDMSDLTAAHRSLPLQTRVRVTNMRNGRSVVVRINDRGPYVRGRIIDLSSRAARLLGMRHDGLAPVRLEVVAADRAPEQVGAAAGEVASARQSFLVSRLSEGGD